MKSTLYVDPGASGGFAWRDHDGIVQAAPMPEGMTAQVDWLREWHAEASWGGQPMTTVSAVMEKVGGYMPGNSGPAAAKFARHCGHLEAALYCMGISTAEVAPGVWMRKLGAMPKDKQERKRAIKEHVQRLFPHLKVTLKTADALGMLAAGEGEQ